MSSSRPRRSTAAPVAAAPPTPQNETPRRSRSSRNVKPEPEPEPEPEVEEEVDEDVEAEEEEEPAAGPSRSRAGRSSKQSKGRVSKGAAPKSRASQRKTEEAEATEGEDDDEEKPYRVRSRKSVSYREVPVEEQEEDAEDESEDQEEETTPPPRKSSQAPDTPSRRKRAEAEEADKEDKSYKFEKIGSGRGGFSVKGAAAAAARARWAKVRREKEERGEVDDDPRERRKSKSNVRRENKAAVEKLKDGEVINIRGVDYTAHNDELPIPDDPKGEAKIDAEGRLQGGREYKVFTFASEGRENNERLYGLTIDVARACGYTDSLAFLRRFPVIQKLQCQPGEAEMLIEIGRVSGNMKHRMVTIIPMRNVFKLMGARIIKDAKWVTDDYYEDEALAKCAENGFTPYAPVHDEEIMANVQSSLGLANKHDREREALNSALKTNILSPFYTLGGPSTHFAGSGIDPWTEGGWGNRRAKLRGIGVTEEDWMYRTASDCRAVDATLKRYREERVGALEGDDLRGWVWTTEANADGEGTGDDKMEIVESPKVETMGLKPPMDRKRSALSREVTFEPEQPGTDEAMTPLPPTDGDVSMDATDPAETPAAPIEGDEDPISRALNGVNGDGGEGEIRVETAEEAKEHKSKWTYGTGSWTPGTIQASYEPHTQMPHVPLFTQPSSADMVRASPYPILESLSDGRHQNFVQSTVRGRAAQGLASVEYVFDPLVNGQLGWDRTPEDEMRKRMIQEAEEWEARSRDKRRRQTTGVAV